MRMNAFRAGLLLIALGTSACSNDGGSAPEVNGVLQTNFPGQVSAGGGTSGEVMARNTKLSDTRDPSGTPGIPQGAGGNTGGAAMGGTSGATGGTAGGSAAGVNGSPNEAVRGQDPSGDVSGTPGIPEGSGGNTSGAEMGGTTAGAAGTETAPPQDRAPGVSSPQRKQ